MDAKALDALHMEVQVQKLTLKPSKVYHTQIRFKQFTLTELLTN